MSEKVIPFGYEVVPESTVFLAEGERYENEDRAEWDSWAEIVMRTRLFVVGTPAPPDSRGVVLLAYALVQLPTEEGKPSIGLTPPFAKAICLN